MKLSCWMHSANVGLPFCLLFLQWFFFVSPIVQKISVVHRVFFIVYITCPFSSHVEHFWLKWW